MELDEIDISQISDADVASAAIAVPDLRRFKLPFGRWGPLKPPKRLKIARPTGEVPGVRYARNAFAIAGVYGLVMTSCLFSIGKSLGAQHPPTMTHPEFFYGFAGLFLAWQVLFLIIALNPVRLRPAMIAGVLQKVAIPLTIVPLFMLGRVGLVLVGLAGVEAFFAVAFGVAYYSCASKR